MAFMASTSHERTLAVMWPCVWNLGVRVVTALLTAWPSHASGPTCSWSPVDATGDYRGSVRSAGGETSFTRPKVQCSGKDTYKGKHPQAPIPQTQVIPFNAIGPDIPVLTLTLIVFKTLTIIIIQTWFISTVFRS